MAPHTTTGEWQSFEMRMRHRRAERLVVRADAALDAQCVDEAREALAEARRLEPRLPDLERIEQRLRGVQAPAASPVASVTPVTSADVPVPSADVPVASADVPVASAFRRKIAPAAAIALIALGGIAYYGLGRDTALEPTHEFHQLAPAVEVPAPQPLPPPASSPASPPPQPVSTTGSVEAAEREAIDAVHAPAATPPPVVPASLREETEPPAPRTAPPAAERTEPRVPVDPPEPPAPRVSGAPGTNLPTAPPPTVPAPASSIDSLPSAAAPPSAPDPALVQAAVKTTLDRYASAYSRLDADAARRVWPGVNRDSLARAFDGLESQQVSLGACSIDVTGARARARCAGSMTWRPKVGDATARTDSRTWTFELARAGAEWTIVSARVQNR